MLHRILLSWLVLGAKLFADTLATSCYVGGINTPNNTNVGNMFNLIVADRSVTLHSISLRLNTGAAGASTVKIWWRPGTFVGFENTPSAWTELNISPTSANSTGSTTFAQTFNLVTPLTLPPGATVGFFCFRHPHPSEHQRRISSQLQYQRPSSNSALTITCGTGKAYAADYFSGANYGSTYNRDLAMQVDYTAGPAVAISGGGGASGSGNPPDNTPTQVISYTEDTSNFSNPERGFYPCKDQYTTIQRWLTDPPVSGIDYDLTTLRAQGVTLVRPNYNLSLYRDGTTTANPPTAVGSAQPIPQTYLNKIQADLDYCRALGLKVILKFAYNWNPLYTGQQDAPLALLQSHLAQLKPIIASNVDVVAWMEESFVGLYGEWHDSKNTITPYMPVGTLQLNADGVTAYQNVLDLLPTARMWACRYPKQTTQVLGYAPLASTPYDGSPVSRTGMFNAGWMYDSSDYGSWSANPSTAQSERTYAATQCAFTLASAEPAGNDGTGYTLNGAIALQQMETFRFTGCAMNQPDAVSDGVYTAWKTSGHYDTMAKRMGYRYRLASATLPTRVAVAQNLQLDLILANNGFARPVNPRLLEIVLKRTSDGLTKRFPITPDGGKDTRLFLPGPGETTSLSLSVAIPPDQSPGTYSVHLNLPDPQPSLYARPEYAIRLANTGVWDATTGMNNLNATVTVLTALENWRQTHFGTFSSTGSAADTADTDADGLANLLEYALGGDPLANSSAPRPTVAVAANHLTLTFTRARSDLTYTVQVSNDLATWSDLATNPGSVGQTVTVTDSSLLSNTYRRFIRLKISTP